MCAQVLTCDTSTKVQILTLKRMFLQEIHAMDSNALSQLHQYIVAHEVEGLVKVSASEPILT